jgi:hypothetical protein
VWADDVIGTLDRQLSQISVAGFGDAKLRVAIAGLAASRAQSEIIEHFVNPAITVASMSMNRMSLTIGQRDLPSHQTTEGYCCKIHPLAADVRADLKKREAGKSRSGSAGWKPHTSVPVSRSL